MQSLKTAQSFFKSVPEDMDLSWSVLDAQALEEAKVDFGQSLARCPEVPQKRQSLLSRQCCFSWGVSFPSFLSFKEMSGVVDFFCSEVEPFPWVEPGLLLFCLDWEEPFPDLLSDLEELDFCSDLFLEVMDVWVSWETSPCCSKYHASMAFEKLERKFGLSWWTILSLMCLASPL